MLRNLDACARLELGIRASVNLAVASATAQMGGLRDFITGVYKERLHALIEEVRVFTGLNAALFGVMLVMMWFKRDDMRPVLLPVAVMLASTGSAAYLYFVTQDWLWSVLLSNYMGFWYLGLVGLTLVFVCDIALFKARLSINVLGTLPQAFIPTC